MIRNIERNMQLRNEGIRRSARGELVVLSSIIVVMSLIAVFMPMPTERTLLVVSLCFMACMPIAQKDYASALDRLDAWSWMNWCTIGWNCYGAALVIVGAIKAMTHIREGVIWFIASLVPFFMVVLSRRATKKFAPWKH